MTKTEAKARDAVRVKLDGLWNKVYDLSKKYPNDKSYTDALVGLEKATSAMATRVVDDGKVEA